MDNERWERLQAIFHHALDLAQAEQEAYVFAESAGDESLAADARAMLAEDALGGSVLDQDLGGLTGAPGSEPLPPGAFGPYRVKGVLGEGGTGIVYLAERVDIGSLVAIKLLREAALSPMRRARFISEQKALGRLNHPLIARIYDAGALADGTPWFVMEYVDGVRITEYCRERNASIDERLRLIRCVCEAVQYAHSQALLHRDLKPSNILVQPDGKVKLLDFGIAKQLDTRDDPAEQTQTGLRPMTLAYASPEQVRGEPLGTPTDVYSLGVTLYEVLTGGLPFDLSNLRQTEAERIIVEQDPEPPSAAARRPSGGGGEGKCAPQAGKAAWADVDVLVMTAMHKDRSHRYGSVEAMARDIDHYFRGEPLEARPDSARYRLAKFVKRNRRSLSAAAAMVTLVVALVAFFVFRLAVARSAAMAEARRTQRIERFMLNLFDGGDKTAGPADSLRVVTLLGRGVENAKTLGSEPAVQAELYQTLGNIYQKLGKLAEADPLLRSSLERRQAIGGAENHNVADSLIALGLLRLDQGKAAEAERLVRQGLDMNRRLLPPQDPDLARGQYALGRVLEDRGAYDQAVKVLDEAVRLQAAARKPDTDLSDSLKALADAQYYLGHLPAAESLNQQALATDRALFGGVHPRVADDLFNLGEVQHDLGHDAEAERYYRQSLAINRSWYGAEHPKTAMSMAAVGQALVYQARYEEAAPVLQQAVATQERIFGKDHPQVAQGFNTLGILEIRRQHYSDAEADFTRMAAINRVVYGDRHYLVGIALLNLGQVYLEEKEYARAEPEYRAALDRFLQNLPADHPSTAIARVQLGHVLTLQRRYQEAEPYLLAGYAVLVKQPGPPTARLQTARKDLAAVDDALHKPEQAGKFRAELAGSEAK